MSECVICRGDRRVRLPVYRRTSPVCFDPSVFLGREMIEESYRTYPCPECEGKQAAEEKVSVIYAENSFQTRGAPPKKVMREAAVEQLVRATVDKIRRDGLIEVREEMRGDEVIFRSRVGVVSPRMVADLNQRAFERMKTFLGDVLSTAKESIAIWGSHYTGNNGMISKGQAIDYVDAAFRRHLAAAPDNHQKGERA